MRFAVYCSLVTMCTYDNYPMWMCVQSVASLLLLIASIVWGTESHTFERWNKQGLDPGADGPSYIVFWTMLVSIVAIVPVSITTCCITKNMHRTQNQLLLALAILISGFCAFWAVLFAYAGIFVGIESSGSQDPLSGKKTTSSAQMATIWLTAIGGVLTTVTQISVMVASCKIACCPGSTSSGPPGLEDQGPADCVLIQCVKGQCICCSPRLDPDTGMSEPIQLQPSSVPHPAAPSKLSLPAPVIETSTAVVVPMNTSAP